MLNITALLAAIVFVVGSMFSGTMKYIDKVQEFQEEIGNMQPETVAAADEIIPISEENPGHEKNTYDIVLRREEQSDGIADLPLRMYMTVTDYDSSTGVVTAVISNQSGYDMMYGNDYWLQKLEDGEWVDLQPEIEYAWTKIAYQLKDLEEVEVEYDLSVFGELDEGTYKLCKNDLEAEFTLFREWTE